MKLFELLTEVKKIKSIAAIAKEVYREQVKSYDDDTLKAVCLNVSRKLKQRLIDNGYKAVVVQGMFFVDNPDESAYEGDLDDVEDEEERERIMHNPLHYWVEVNRNIIVDITASQFNDELDIPVEPILIGTHEELWQYTSLRRDWK